MNERIYYLRTPNRNQVNKDGQTVVTRGDPLAIVMTYVDRTNNTVSYALAAAHPKESFRKSMAKTIVTGRLNTHPVVLNGVPESGHKITEMVMKDIFASDVVGKVKVSSRVRDLASEWLTNAAVPREDARPTVPMPATREAVSQARHAIPPPPMSPREFTDRAAAEATRAHSSRRGRLTA